MRWRAFWYERRNDETKTDDTEYYGFKTHNTPPTHPLLKDFEDDLFKLVKGMKFKKVKNEFLSNMGKFKDEVRQCNDIILKADKTRNVYTLKKEDYNQLLSNNITKDYHKSDGNHVKNINKETQQHAINLQLGDRLDK